MSTRQRKASKPSEILAGDTILRRAFEAWAECLSPAHVVHSGDRLEALNRSTFPHPNRLAGALYPSSRAEIAHCLEIARNNRIPLHVVSRGCNWGYGSRLPARSWAVLMSLERLARIEVDERLAKVHVEPGVTFGQLAAHLREAGSNMLPPEIGAGPETSVLGNALQRGIGKGPYTSMAAQILGLDVMLPDGTFVRTDACGTIAGTSHASPPSSIGPAVTGLFQQSDLGIVLSGRIALHRAPEFRQLMWCTISGPALPRALDKLRTLLQPCDPRLQIELVNGPRAHLQTHGELSIGMDRIDSQWIIAATIWADDEEELGWRRSAVERAFTFAESGVARAPVERRDTFGRPDWSGLDSAYAYLGRKAAAGADPDRDGTGLIWVAPEVPFLGEIVAELLPHVGALISSYGLLPAVSMRPANGRDLRLLIAITWDRKRRGGDRSAIECATAVRALLESRGMGMYRPGILDNGPRTRDAGARHILTTLADAVDPHRILANSFPREHTS